MTQGDQATVVDRRPVPRNRIPSQGKAWALAAIVVGMVIVMVTGGPEPMPTRMTVPATAGLVPDPDRLEAYQSHLETLRPVAAAAPVPMPVPVGRRGGRQAAEEFRTGEGVSGPADRSLFASSVVAPEGGARTVTRPRADDDDEPDGAVPSLGEIARVVARELAPAAGRDPVGGVAKQDAGTAAPPLETRAVGGHVVREGTVIDGTLVNRLDGSFAGPVNALITLPVYAQDLTLVVPRGARALGMARPVQAFGDARLAVAFHRIVLPNGAAVSLNQFVGMNQRGDVGLSDQVNRHYLSTFGAAAAVGAITGLSQWIGGGFNRRNNGVIVVAGVGDASTQAASQVMQQFLNRMPTITIREGARLKVYVTSDLDLPAYRAAP